MNYALVLDTSPLSEIVRRPGQSPKADACRLWLRAMIAGGSVVYVPEIADYEVRRELVRLGNAASVARLNTFLTTVEYLRLLPKRYDLQQTSGRRPAIAGGQLPTRKRWMGM